MSWKQKCALFSAGGVILAAAAQQYAARLPQNLFILQAKINVAAWLLLHLLPLVGIGFSVASRRLPIGRALLLFHVITTIQVWG